MQCLVLFDKASDLHEVATIASARPDRGDKLEVECVDLQARAHEGVGKDEGGIGAVLCSHVLTPGLSNADHDLEFGIDLTDDFHESDGEVFAFVFPKGEHTTTIARTGQMPGSNLVTVAPDGSGDVIAHESRDATQVALPQPQPIGQSRCREVDEWTGGDGSPSAWAQDSMSSQGCQ